MAAESVGEAPATATEYIKHHLEYLSSGQGFLVLHLDSIVIKFILAALFVGLLYAAARRATPGVPGRFQAAVELLVEFVDHTVKESFHGQSRLIAPLALTIFGLVFFMNFMDMLPVDLLPAVGRAIGLEHLRVVPTADLNTTAGMAICVFILIQYFGIKHKGLGVFFGEFVTAPLFKMKLL